MNDLEGDYPQVDFVYMTGHLDGGGPSGTLYSRTTVSFGVIAPPITKYSMILPTSKAIIRRAPITPMGLIGVSGVAPGVRLTVARATVVKIVPTLSVSTATAKARPFGGCWHGLAGWNPSAAILYVDPAGLCNDFTPCYTTIQMATSAADDGDQIWIMPKEIIMKPLRWGNPRTLILRGGWNDSYSTQTPNRTLVRAPQVTAGSLTFQIVNIIP